MPWAPNATLRNRQYLDALDICYDITRREPQTVRLEELPAYVRGIIRAQQEALLKKSQLPPEHVMALYTKKCARALKPMERVVAILRAEFVRRIDDSGPARPIIDWVVKNLATHMYQLELTRRIVKEVVAAEDSLIELADEGEGSSYLLAEPVD